MGGGAGAGDSGNGKTVNSDENSSAPQLQKSKTNAESPDRGHRAGKGYRGFTDDRHYHAPVKQGRYLNKNPTGGLQCKRAHRGP